MDFGRAVAVLGATVALVALSRRNLRQCPTQKKKETLVPLLADEQVRKAAEQFGTPIYVYSHEALLAAAKRCLAFPHQYGLIVRFAMKSCPNAAILKVFDAMGIHIDASSGYEVERAIRAGIPASHISLSSQELPANFAELLDAGVHINACSLSQIERVGSSRPNAAIGLRINPGLGSGDHMKKNVGGPWSSFGIWHAFMDKAKEIVARYSLRVVKIHTHIGSGSDPAVWQYVSSLSLQLCQHFETVDTLNLGGGYKVANTILIDTHLTSLPPSLTSLPPSYIPY
jgi:diaminopimelate decarboxylase